MAGTLLSRFGFVAAGIAVLSAAGPARAGDDAAVSRKAFLEAVAKRDEAGVRSGAAALAAADNRAAVAALLQGYGALAVVLHGEIAAKLDPLQKEIDELSAKAEEARNEAGGQKDKSGEVKRLNKKRQNLQEQVNALEADADKLRKLLAVIPEQLGRMKNPEAVDELVSGATKSGTEWGLRAGMVEVLGTSDHPDALKTLLGLVSPKQEPAAGVRIAAINALAKKGGKEAVEAVAAALSDPYWQVQAAAVDALKALNAKESAGGLIGALKDAKGAMKERVNGALVALTGVDKHGDYATWKDWLENGAKAAEKSSEDNKPETGGAAPAAAAPLVLKGGPGRMTSFYGIPVVSKRLVFVLDRSGSMKGPANWQPGEEDKVVFSGPNAPKQEPPKLGKDPRKIDVAKFELEKAVRGLPEDAEFNVIFYAGGAQIWRQGALLPATKANQEAAIAFIRDVEPKGNTNIYDPLKAALDLQGSVPGGKKGAGAAPAPPAGKPGMTSAQPAPVFGGADTVYLLSDGIPTAGSIKKPEKILEKIGEDNKVFKVTIHVIGIGMKQGKAGGDFLKKLAESTGGTFVER